MMSNPRDICLPCPFFARNSGPRRQCEMLTEPIFNSMAARLGKTSCADSCTQSKTSLSCLHLCALKPGLWHLRFGLVAVALAIAVTVAVPISIAIAVLATALRRGINDDTEDPAANALERFLGVKGEPPAALVGPEDRSTRG